MRVFDRGRRGPACSEHVNTLLDEFITETI